MQRNTSSYLKQNTYWKFKKISSLYELIREGYETGELSRNTLQLKKNNFIIKIKNTRLKKKINRFK